MAVTEPILTDLPAAAPPRLGLLTKTLYGAGEICLSVKSVLFGLFTFFFYTTVMGLPATLVGLAAGFGLVWDALVDPLIGQASDRARLRFGRRHAFMLVGAATLWLPFWLHFSPPRGLGTPALLGWFLLTNLLTRLTSSVFAVPFSALGAELSADYHGRTSVAGFRGASGLLGALLAGTLSFLVFFPNADSGADPKLNYAAYSAMGLAFGLAMSAAALASTLTTLPLRPYLRSGIAAERAGLARGLGAGFATALRLPAFRMLFFSSCLVFLASAITTILFVHFLTYYVGITSSQALGQLQFTFYAGAITGSLVWLRVARAVEKRHLYLLATTVVAALAAGAFFLLGEGHLFGQGDVRPVLVLQALAGFFGSLFWILPASMLADIADAAELASGQPRHGTLFGIFGLGQQLALGLATLISGQFVEGFAGLLPGQVEQSALTIQRIGLLFGVLPAALFLAGALIMLRYPLDRRRHAAIRAELSRASQP